MASPFAIFRKHERLLMAIAGVMAMIAFVFFDPLFGMRSGRSRGGPQDPVVAETKLYGDIHESDIGRHARRPGGSRTASLVRRSPICMGSRPRILRSR